MSIPILTEFDPFSVQFGLTTNTQVFQSPLNGIVQTKQLPGARWKQTFNYRNLNDSKASILSAFLASLRGSNGEFTAHNYAHPVALGTPTGTPVVAGGSQTGVSLNTSGWTNSTAIFKRGDMLTVNGELKMIIADVSSDGGGLATLSFEPALRSSPLDLASITVIKPTSKMRLVDDSQYEIDTSECLISGISFTGIEVF